jgi:CubicO group peptidase (beta-lactamase class C family)
LKFEQYIRNLIGNKIFPGISVLVGSGNRIILKRWYGFRSLIPETTPLEEDTLYDTASLTKPLITSFLVIYLIEKKEIALNTDVKSIITGFPHSMTILQLLTHTSGLPAWYPFYLYGNNYLDQFKTIHLESKPGQRVNYSCPGYILLYHVIKKVSGTDFAGLAENIILTKTGLKRSFFRIPADLKIKTAPTEKGNRIEKKMAEKTHKTASRKFEWRRQIILGETHDANSHYLGGTAGNSGLFSTASDLFRLSLEIYPETATILKPESIKLFWNNFTPGEKSHRSLGFKLNTSILTSGGRRISSAAIGHSGFTGTSIWLEPESQTTFILLTNRIHPVAKRINFDRRRRKLHGLLKSDLDLK